MPKIYHFSKYIKGKEKVTFSKKDLNSIISIYSQNYQWVFGKIIL